MPYDSFEDIIRDRLKELIEEGRLTGENIEFDGVSLLEVETEYRPDGYTYATFNGCRRHRVIDDILERYRNGTKQQQDIADNFPEWFAFNVNRYPDVAAEDGDERELARSVHTRWGVAQKWVLGARNPIAIYPFINRDGFVEPKCGMVLGAGQSGLPGLLPAHVADLLHRIDNDMNVFNPLNAG